MVPVWIFFFFFETNLSLYFISTISPYYFRSYTSAQLNKHPTKPTDSPNTESPNRRINNNQYSNENDSVNFADESRVEDEISELSTKPYSQKSVQSNEKNDFVLSPDNIEKFIANLGARKLAALGNLDQESDDEDIQDLLKLYASKKE